MFGSKKYSDSEQEYIDMLRAFSLREAEAKAVQQEQLARLAKLNADSQQILINEHIEDRKAFNQHTNTDLPKIN